MVSAARAAPPPVEAFGDLPAIADVHLSPDGSHFSALEPVDLYRVNVEDNSQKEIASGSKNTVQWIVDGHGGAAAV
jgi:hypothetical protein